MRVCQVCGARFKGTPRTCPLDGGTLVDLPDPLVGRNVGGRYHVLEKIGAGGMGAVYRARHEVVGRDVAIKFLAPELASDETSRQRFLREARAANRIHHENIIEVHDFGETDDGLVFLVMEYLEGKSLAHVIAKGPMSVRRALGIAAQIAGALARAHELDVIHRDIKPDNVYILARGQGVDFVKVLDFGLAHMKGELRLTATGTVFGTPEYIAPEQARGAPLTPSVDLYALGCVLYEMLTGQLPFKGSTPDLILKHIRQPAPRASLLAPVPPFIDEIVLKLMAKDPAARHKDAYHLLEDLRKAMDLVPADAPQRVSDRPQSIALDATTPSAKPSSVQRSANAETASWAERVALFRAMVVRAYPRNDPPAWVASSVADLEEDVAAIREARLELDRCATAAAQVDERMREARLRIGRALDELVRDESRNARDLTELDTRDADAKARTAELARPLVVAWCAVPSVPVSGPTMTREVAEALRDAGPLAAAWLEIERSAAATKRELEIRRRERDDLTFQIAQLKGRLGTMHAEAEMETGSLRARAARLDTQVSARLEALVAKASPVAQHLMQFPELRAALGAIPPAARA